MTIILKSFALAVIFYIFCCFMLLNCFVWPKWNTIPANAEPMTFASIMRNVTAQSRNNNSSNTTAANSNNNETIYDNMTDTQQKQLQDLKKLQASKLNEIAATKRRIQARFVQLDNVNLDDRPQMLSLSGKNKTYKLFANAETEWTNSIVNRQDATVDAWLDQVSSWLSNAADPKKAVHDWKTVNQLVQQAVVQVTEYTGPRVVKRPTGCPKYAWPELVDTTTGLPQHFVTIDDWQELEKSFVSSIQAATPTNKSSLAGNKQLQTQLSSTLNKLWAEWLEEQKSTFMAAASSSNSGDKQATAKATTSTNSKDCIRSIDAVEPWIEAALEAQRQGQDVRQKILQKIRDDGYDTSKIILDADLDSRHVNSGRDMQSTSWSPLLSSSVKKGTSLQAALDSPAWKLLPPMIDWTIENVMSGWVDSIDEKLDALPTKWSEDAVREIHRKLGRVNIM